MKIISHISDLQNQVQAIKSAGLSIGFVPTMGALHAGHMALIARAKKECDVVISSVFVNPTQFNNSEDLKLYPRTPDKDAELLESHGCDLAFFPNAAEMYPSGWVRPFVDLNGIDRVMEGEFRPGHFEGVVEVVGRFFELVQPNKAFFGMKDFQQVAVIQRMVDELGMPVEIVPCPTLREASGLAMSSRNMRLSAQQREDALHIFRTLQAMKSFATAFSPHETLEKGVAFFNTGSLQLEYLQIVHPQTLLPLSDQWVDGAVACIACFCGNVRLIDNLILIEK